MMQNPEAACRTSLEAIGYAVEKLQESGVEKIYDFNASFNNKTLAIEVKSKEDDRNVQAQLAKAGTTGIFSSDASRTERFQNRFDDARQQLSKAPTNAFKMVWYSLLEARDFELAMEQLDYLLYGTQQIFGGGGIRNCYLYHESFFERERWLSGVLIRAQKGFVLWPNPFAERATEFRETRLYQVALAGDFVWRPLETTQERGQYLMAYSIDRTNDAGKLAYLRQTYNLGQIFPLNMGHHTGYFSIPRVGLEITEAQ